MYPSSVVIVVVVRRPSPVVRRRPSSSSVKDHFFICESCTTQSGQLSTSIEWAAVHIRKAWVILGPPLDSDGAKMETTLTNIMEIRRA